jgi:hypothetical protein
VLAGASATKAESGGGEDKLARQDGILADASRQGDWLYLRWRVRYTLRQRVCDN